MDGDIDDNDNDRWDEASEGDEFMHHDDSEQDSLEDERQVWVNDLVYPEKSRR